MIVRRFSDIHVGFDCRDGVPEIGFPPGLVETSMTGEEADIHVSLEMGHLNVAVPSGPVRLKRGRLSAHGDPGRLVWIHPELGPFIEVFSFRGEARVVLPGWAWQRCTDILDQVLLPALLPPFAARGLRAMHASSVEVEGKGVMIAGAAGSGKTTAALLVVSAGGRLVADDLTFLSRHRKEFKIYGLGEGPKASQATWSRFTQWRPETADFSGKRRLKTDALPWTGNARLGKLVILDKKAGVEINSQGRLLTRLLTYTYYDVLGAAAVRSLLALINSVEVHIASSSEEAAGLAMGRSWAI